MLVICLAVCLLGQQGDAPNELVGRWKVWTTLCGIPTARGVTRIDIDNSTMTWQPANEGSTYRLGKEGSLKTIDLLHEGKVDRQGIYDFRDGNLLLHFGTATKRPTMLRPMDVNERYWEYFLQKEDDAEKEKQDGAKEQNKEEENGSDHDPFAPLGQ